MLPVYGSLVGIAWTLLLPGQADLSGTPMPAGALLRLGERFQFGSQVLAMALSADGKRLASASQDQTIRLWDVARGEELNQLRGHEGRVSSLAFAPDGKTLVSGSWDRTLRVWDIASAKELQRFTGHPREVLCVAFSRDGQTLASGGRDATLWLWQAATGKPLRPLLPGHQKAVRALAFAPDGKTLASGGDDGAIRLWDMATGRLVRQLGLLPGAWHCLAFAPDGRTLAAGGQDADKAIRLWDVATGKELRPLLGHQSSVGTLAFSPDGKTLASGSMDQSLRVWELATRSVVRQLEGHQGTISSVAFAPDGRTLASGSLDSMILIWDLTGRLDEGRLRPMSLSFAELKRLWLDLGGPDANKADQAIWTLASAPQQTVAFLAESLRSMFRVNGQRLAELIRDLDSERFTVRQQATIELEMLSEWVEPALRKVVANPPSLEVCRRAELILEKLDKPTPSPETLRMIRAVRVLEQIGTPEARQVLQTFARGTSEDRLTLEAQASLQRLTKRPATS
jgi:WD40 repeat protein